MGVAYSLVLKRIQEDYTHDLRELRTHSLSHFTGRITLFVHDERAPVIESQAGGHHAVRQKNWRTRPRGFCCSGDALIELLRSNADSLIQSGWLVNQPVFDYQRDATDVAHALCRIAVDENQISKFSRFDRT